MVQLHLHSLYSLLDGISTSEEYVKKAQKYNHSSIAITDHGKCSNFFNHSKACVKSGIKPIFGIEMYVTHNLVTMEKEKRIRGKNNHVILLAENEEGYKNLLRLNYLSMSDETHFYYSPRVSMEEVFENSKGLYCGTACIGSPFAYALKDGNDVDAENLFIKFMDVFKDRFYAEIQLNELTNEINGLKNGQKTYNDWIIEKANKHGVPIVVTGDVHYAEKGQDQLQTLAIAIRNKDTIDKLTFELESKNLYYHDTIDYINFNKEYNYNYDEKFILSCCNNSDFIANKLDYKMPERTKMILPKVSDDDEALLIQKAKDGLSDYFKLPFENCPIEYKKRLGTELEVIIRKGFCSYLLILEDMFKFARENDITHSTSRGSAGGSLIVFCLKMTTIDPLKFGLLFERFISANRMADCVYDYFVDDKENL